MPDPADYGVEIVREPISRYAGDPTGDAPPNRYFLEFAAAARRAPARPAGAPIPGVDRSGAGTPPELDLARVRRFCRDRVPAHVRDRIRLDLEQAGRRLTIIERRAPWTPEIGPEWTSSRFAQLRLHATEQTWTLYWADRNNVWHRDLIEPTTQVDRLLARISDDPANRYWG